MARKLTSLLEAQEAEAQEERKERRYGQYLLDDTRKKSNSLKLELSLRQADRKKFDKLFGEWIIVFSVPATIVWLLFQTPKIQTSDIIQIIGVSLFGICYTIWILRKRKSLRKKLEII